MSRIESLTLQYQCPKCKQNIQRLIPFIYLSTKESPMIFQGWCTFRYCEAQHLVEYTTKHEKKDEKPKIKIDKFTCNGESYQKKFFVSEWSNIEGQIEEQKEKE